MKPKLKKQLTTILKISVSALLIWLVFSKLNWNEVGRLLQVANLIYFGLAIICFLASQLISVLRFDLFIRKIGIRMSFQVNIRLYLLGMFYNFFLPGGVGGDAYKVYLLNKSHQKSFKKIGEVVFIERFIGVVAIGFLASMLIMFIETPLSRFWNIGIGVCGFAVTLIILKWVIRYLHSHKKRVYIVFAYSILIQLFQLGCVFFILKSFHIDDHYLIYLLLFLVSSVLSVISFAGIGIREAVFYYGAHWYDFNPDISASVALSFSIFTAILSFAGIIWLFGGIRLENRQKQNDAEL